MSLTYVLFAISQFLFELGKKNLTKKQMQACFQFILPTPGSNVLSLEDFVSGVRRLYEIQFLVPITRRSRGESINASTDPTKMIKLSPSSESKFTDDAIELEKLILAEKKRTLARKTQLP
jgi:hypothetical protein